MAVKIELPSGLNSTDAINGYLFKMAENLNYILNNLTAENFTDYAKSSITSGEEANIRIAELNEEQQAALQQYRNDLLQEIITTATSTANSTTVAIQENADNIKALVASLYVAQTEGDDTKTVAELKQYTSSLVTQTDESVRLDFSKVEDVANQTAEGLESYINTNNTYIRFSESGVEVGKKLNDNTVPYSVLISNEKMSFLNNGVEVAYIQYNKLFITQAEIVNRFSVGSPTNGYLDIITTETGMGFKWREVV